MTKKIRNNIIYGLPIIIFIISGILYYHTILNVEKSFIKLNTSLPDSEIELQEENYNLYSLNLDNNIQKDLKVNVFENKTHDTLNISLLKEKRFIWPSQTTKVDNKIYNLLSVISISKKGRYHIAIQNPHKVKIQFVIQNQNDDNTFLKSILVYYLVSIISLGTVIIVVIVAIVKSMRVIIRNKKNSFLCLH
nr:hypothetical protein [uncultured Flavobacterium sp.]